MKILYGVQGTGNGHITRARLMARHFSATGADVQYLFSGRERGRYFDMECFGDALYKQGLTFVTELGRVSYGQTALRNNMFRFGFDVAKLDLSPYDLILTDYEPITAWAAKLRGRRAIGIGHQYAFGRNVPREGENPVANLVMKYFAPVHRGIGFHWHHFNHDNILPPIIDDHLPGKRDGSFYLVYLPFEHQSTVTTMLNCLEDYQFIQYAPTLNDSSKGNVQLRKTCHDGFKRDLSHCKGVICNAGFELVSECLHMRLPLLVKPVQGQLEQLSNAAALRQLKYAKTIYQLTPESVNDWLQADKPVPSLAFPNVADALVKWINAGAEQDGLLFTERLWAQMS